RVPSPSGRGMNGRRPDPVRASRWAGPGRTATLMAMRAGASIVPALPRGAIGPLGEIGGAAAYALGGPSRRRLVGNLTAVLDRHDPDLLALRAREAFRTQTANYLDLFRLPRLRLDEVERLIDLSGWAHLEAAPGGGKGAIL